MPFYFERQIGYYRNAMWKISSKEIVIIISLSIILPKGNIVIKIIL